MTLLQIATNRFQKITKTEERLFQIIKLELIGLISMMNSSLSWESSQQNFQEQYIFMLDLLFQHITQEQISDFISDIMKHVKKIKLDSTLVQVVFLICKYHSKISVHSNDLFILLDERIFKSRENFTPVVHSSYEAGNIKIKSGPQKFLVGKNLGAIETIFLMGLKCKEKYPRIKELLSNLGINFFFTLFYFILFYFYFYFCF